MHTHCVGLIMKPTNFFPGLLAEVNNSPAKPEKDIRQLPTAPKEQKRTVTQQVVPTASKITQRQDIAPKLNHDTKIVAGKKNAERKPVETRKINKKNEVKKVGDAKKTATKTNDGLSQNEKSVPQKPVIARANLAKIEEKPSISCSPGKTVVKGGASGQKVDG